MQCKCQGFDIRIIIPGRFSIAKGGAKIMVLTLTLSTGGGAYSRALITERSEYPPFSGGMAVVINDWCIMWIESRLPHISMMISYLLHNLKQLFLWVLNFLWVLIYLISITLCNILCFGLTSEKKSKNFHRKAELCLLK